MSIPFLSIPATTDQCEQECEIVRHGDSRHVPPNPDTSGVWSPPASWQPSANTRKGFILQRGAPATRGLDTS